VPFRPLLDEMRSYPSAGSLRAHSKEGMPRVSIPISVPTPAAEGRLELFRLSAHVNL
jgi:hypothetical protein